MLLKNGMPPEYEKIAFSVIENSMLYLWSAALRSAAVLGVADKLVEGEKTADQLAGELNVDAISLCRMMRILASRGVFEEKSEGCFTLTSAAEFLRTDNPYSLRDAILMLTDTTFWLPVFELPDRVRGKNVFKSIFGMAFYDYWSQQDHASGDTLFHSGMSSMSKVENEVLVRNVEFPEHATVVDVAGGYGNMLLNILRKNPTLKGILFDRPDVLSGNMLHQLGDNSRWTLTPGSFFEKCPAGDIYILKYIVMDWSDAEAIKILRCCRNAMLPNGKIVIMEPVVSEGENSLGGCEIDLLLLASFDGGRIRTETELRDMLAKSGLRLERIIKTETYLSIVEAVAA